MTDAIDEMFGKEFAYDVQLYRMCDQGVREAAKRGGIWFKVWPSEVKKVKSYMARKHPGIEFKVSWPEWKDSGAYGVAQAY